MKYASTLATFFIAFCALDLAYYFYKWLQFAPSARVQDEYWSLYPAIVEDFGYFGLFKLFFLFLSGMVILIYEPDNLPKEIVKWFLLFSAAVLFVTNIIWLL